MKIEFTKKEMRVLRVALLSAIQNEETLIDAHTCQFCHGTKVFQDRSCLCKTGAMKGSMKIIRKQEKLISEIKKVFQKIYEHKS